MKRTLKIVLAISLIMIFVLSVVSCGAGGNLDIDKAESALKDEEYNVNIVKDDDYNGIPVVRTFIANKGTEYISIVEFEKSATAKLFYQNAKALYDAEIEEIENEIKLYEHFLKEYDDVLKSDEIDDFEDEVKSLKEELDDAKEDYAFGYSGKVFWYGTADAVEDAKG